MTKGRRRAISKEKLRDILEALQFDPTLTKRELAFYLKISVQTLYRYLNSEEARKIKLELQHSLNPTVYHTSKDG